MLWGCRGQGHTRRVRLCGLVPVGQSASGSKGKLHIEMTVRDPLEELKPRLVVSAKATDAIIHVNAPGRSTTTVE